MYYRTCLLSVEADRFGKGRWCERGWSVQCAKKNPEIRPCMHC